MAKKFDGTHRYIDSEKTLLKTANNLYDDALTQMGRAETIQKECGLPKAVGFYQIINRNLHEALLFGKAEAAAALAYLYREGLGVEKSEYKDKFLVAVGAKLGDPTCLNIFKKDATRVYTDVFSEAKQWVEAIKEISTRYPNKDAEISVSAAVWADKQLESHCPQSHSYQRPSSSHLNDLYETPNTSFGSEPEDDVGLAGSHLAGGHPPM